MPVSKIDPKVIFASDAPSTDKPPVFNDKTKGWDEARTNDGRPTIKQMNKLQQDTDLKILWLNENAVAPFDETIDYPEGAVTLKDGSFKILEDGTWVEFLDKSSIGLGNVDNTSDLNKPISTATQTALNAKADLDPVKRGIGNTYDSSLSYNINDRVLLDDGTEVTSTIASNTNDPNVDMTGWVETNVASQIFDESGLSQQQINNVVTKFVVSNSELIAIENPSSGWVYRVLETSTTYQFNSSQSAVNNGGTILNGWVAVGLKYVTPEMFGADPTGATSSRLAINAMISSLADGGVIELKPNAIYYNDCPNGAADEWRILQNNVYILAHGATFKRRATSLETASIDVNMAALRVDGDNVTIEGKVRFDGSEAYADIVNTSGVSIATGEYVRGYASSHGLYLNRANNFTALDIDSRNAVFNVYASNCSNLNIKGYCKSSGQVYPLVGGDLQLGSGIKTADCTNINIDLITDYAGYAGCEIEPRCKIGHVKSIARNPSFYGAIFQNGCEDFTFKSVATGATNGSPLRIGQGCKRIVGTYTGSGCKHGLLLEPSSSDATPTGDITQCDIRGVSSNCTNRAVLLVNWPSGGAVRESSIHHRSNNDGGGTRPAFTIENAVNCSFDLGVNAAKGAIVVNRVYESEIHMAYMKNITDANPMYFTAGNTVDLTCRVGGVTYVLKQTNGLLFGSSLNTSAAALPVATLTAFDIRASQIATPSLPTVNSSAIANGLWVDTANASTIKRKVT